MRCSSTASENAVGGLLFLHRLNAKARSTIGAVVDALVMLLDAAGLRGNVFQLPRTFHLVDIVTRWWSYWSKVKGDGCLVGKMGKTPVASVVAGASDFTLIANALSFATAARSSDVDDDVDDGDGNGPCRLEERDWFEICGNQTLRAYVRLTYKVLTEAYERLVCPVLQRIIRCLSRHPWPADSLLSYAVRLYSCARPVDTGAISAQPSSKCVLQRHSPSNQKWMPSRRSLVKTTHCFWCPFTTFQTPRRLRERERLIPRPSSNSCSTTMHCCKPTSPASSAPLPSNDPCCRTAVECHWIGWTTLSTQMKSTPSGGMSFAQKFNSALRAVLRHKHKSRRSLPRTSKGVSKPASPGRRRRMSCALNEWQCVPTVATECRTEKRLSSPSPVSSVKLARSFQRLVKHGSEHLLVCAE